MALRVGKKVPLKRRITPQRVAAAERRRATIRRTLIGLTTLILLAIVGGAGYTWYMGEQNLMASNIEKPMPSRRVEIRPVRQDPNANVGVAIQMLTSPVTPGDNASVTVRTNQRANCNITVTYNDVKSTDSGLMAKTADDFGMASWSWKVEPSAPAGTWPVDITCATKKKSGMVRGDLTISAR